MNFLSELERLIAERAEHVKSVARIDDELERARLALNGAEASVPKFRRGPRPGLTRAPRGERSPSGFWDAAVLTALSEREPQQVSELQVRLRASSSVQRTCHRLWQQGVLIRRGLATGKGKAQAYARSPEAFTGANGIYRDVETPPDQIESEAVEPG